MVGVFERLAAGLTPSQARRVASSLRIDGNVNRAAARLPHDAGAALCAAFESVGASTLADVLSGFAAAVESGSVDLRPVWSGPTFEGDGDHTTAALAHLIDEATEDVFASTYSASTNSLYVQALWRAVARGVRTTLLLDADINGGKTVAMLQRRLSGARFLGFRPGPGGGVQHSKVVIIDSRAAFITSANLSEAAHERNLEVGVIVRDPDFASGIRRRFTELRSAGHVYALDRADPE